MKIKIGIFFWCLTSQPFAWILLPKIVDAQVPSWSRLEQVSSLKVFIVVQHCFVFLGSTLTHFNSLHHETSLEFLAVTIHCSLFLERLKRYEDALDISKLVI